MRAVKAAAPALGVEDLRNAVEQREGQKAPSEHHHPLPDRRGSDLVDEEGEKGHPGRYGDQMEFPHRVDLFISRRRGEAGVFGRAAMATSRGDRGVTGRPMAPEVALGRRNVLGPVYVDRLRDTQSRTA